MYALLFFILSLAPGILCLRLLPIIVNYIEAGAMAVSMGVLLSSWVLFLLTLLMGYQAAVWVGAALCGVVVIALFLTHHKGRVTIVRIPDATWSVWSVFTAVTILWLGYLLHTHMLNALPDGWYSGGDTWGDIALHVSLISHFAHQANFTSAFSLYPEAKLSYPFLFDFYTSFLLRLGWSWQMTLVVPGFILGISALQLLFWTGVRVLKSVAASVLGVTLFVFSGSAVGFYYLYQDWQASGTKLWDFMATSGIDYAHITLQNLQSTNFITSLLLPQRTFLIALPLFLLLLILLQHAFAEERPSTSLLLTVGGITGLLPLIHTHTFVVAILLLGWFVLQYCWNTRSVKNIWVGALILAIALAVPQLLWQITTSVHQGFGSWYVGWMRAPQESFLLFWLRNWGVLFLGGILGYFALRSLPVFLRHVYVVMGIIFIMANVYLFQPNPWDNIKLLLYVYIGFAWVVSYWVVHLWSGKAIHLYWRRPVLVAVVASLTLTGVATMLRETYKSDLLFSNADLRFAQSVQAATPDTAVIMTSNRHNNPIPTLTGRTIVMGYPGWLWTYGINYTATEQDVYSLYAGVPNERSLLQKHAVQYIAIGPTERQDNASNTTYFAAHPELFSLVVTQDSGTYLLYKVTPSHETP